MRIRQALTVTVSHASARTDVLDELGGYVQATDISPTYSTTYGELYGLDTDEDAADRKRNNRRAVSASAFSVTGASAGAPTTPFQLYSYTLLHERVADQPRTCSRRAAAAANLELAHGRCRIWDVRRARLRCTQC